MPVTPLTSGLPVALLAFGILLLIVGVLTLIRHRRRRQSWRNYRGQVVASRLEDGQFRSQVSYVRDGREHMFWNRFTASALSDPVGREVGVLVNPEDPDDAVVSSGLTGGGAVGTTVALVGGAVVLVATDLLG